jgi:SAM-dependent methyltransferase
MKQIDLNFDSRYSWAVDMVRELQARNPAIQTILDIGAGDERLRVEIERLGLKYYSFDLFPQNDRVRKWNIEEPYPYTEKADAVIFLEVIEHLTNPGLCLKNVADVINKGGHLILSTPNPAWSGNRMHLLGNGVLGMFTEEDLRLNHHVFTPWYHIIKYMLQSSGFAESKYYPLGKQTDITDYPFWGLKMPVRLGFRLIKKAIEAKDAVAKGAMYGVVAIKG